MSERIRSDENQVTIGLLVSRANKKLRQRILDLTDLAECSIGGEVVAFSLKGIRKTTNVINGYVYSTKEKNWNRSIFPMPDAIINQISLSHKWERYFTKVVGEKMINNFTFSKWELYEWLSQHNNYHNYLPYTERLDEPNKVLTFLQEKQEAYLKPIFGSYGKGIMKITKQEDVFQVKVRSKKKVKTFYWNEKELLLCIQKTCKPNTYIIQQVIDLYIRNRPIDFRLITVKNGGGEWENIGLLARKGSEGEIVSNTGVVKAGNSGLQNLLSLPKWKAIELRTKMSQLAVGMAQQMEKYKSEGGNLGNLGFDFAVDKNQNLWMIEMNHRNPRHQMAVDTGMHAMYVQANQLMMEYATSIAQQSSFE
ncbi:YheC/YheD family endospore coat-associated protein [Alkalihalobacterium bogoriense]|uniref:YheC/YheD family endospore coat-associated protein n=1 Tax=Alkalihalobacterium bogoriense TaxID=246272 RepID=UPI00047EB5C2|nr:YheC/YheD family protein [Alkalihalobacterium bogoriense]